MSVGPRPMVYIDLSMTDTRNGRMPTGLEKKNSIDVQMATATQSRAENSGESVPGKCGQVTCHQEHRENKEILVSVLHVQTKPWYTGSQNSPFHVLPHGNTVKYITPPSTSRGFVR